MCSGQIPLFRARGRERDMETAKERALAWAREDNERRARAQNELERDEQELAELEIYLQQRDCNVPLRVRKKM